MIAAQKANPVLKRRKRMNHHYQLIVIGSGSGGKDAAILGARVGLRVLLVEKDNLGGTCFHRGCLLHANSPGVRNALSSSREEFPFRTLRSIFWKRDGRIGLLQQRRVSAGLVEDLSRTLEGLGVQIRFGTAKLLNPSEVRDFDLTGLGIEFPGRILLSRLARDRHSRASKTLRFLTVIRCSKTRDSTIPSDHRWRLHRLRIRLDLSNARSPSDSG